MDENTKSTKLMMYLIIATLVVVIVTLGLQVYQIATVKPLPPLGTQQQDSQRPQSTAPSQQQSGQSASMMQQQGGTMPMGGQAPSGGQQSGGQMMGKCGDGVCGTIEKENGICPTDCK